MRRERELLIFYHPKIKSVCFGSFVSELWPEERRRYDPSRRDFTFDRGWGNYQDFGLQNIKSAGELLMDFLTFFGYTFNYDKPQKWRRCLALCRSRYAAYFGPYLQPLFDRHAECLHRQQESCRKLPPQPPSGHQVVLQGVLQSSFPPVHYNFILFTTIFERNTKMTI